MPSKRAAQCVRLNFRRNHLQRMTMLLINVCFGGWGFHHRGARR
jgi:hypothetical protein